MRGRMAPPSIVSALELASGAVVMPRKRGRRVVSDDDGDGDHLGRVDEGPSTGSINSVSFVLEINILLPSSDLNRRINV